MLVQRRRHATRWGVQASGGPQKEIIEPREVENPLVAGVHCTVSTLGDKRKKKGGLARGIRGGKPRKGGAKELCEVEQTGLGSRKKSWEESPIPKGEKEKGYFKKPHMLYNIPSNFGGGKDTVVLRERLQGGKNMFGFPWASGLRKG